MPFTERMLLNNHVRISFSLRARARSLSLLLVVSVSVCMLFFLLHLDLFQYFIFSAVARYSTATPTASLPPPSPPERMATLLLHELLSVSGYFVLLIIVILERSSFEFLGHYKVKESALRHGEWEFELSMYRRDIPNGSIAYFKKSATKSKQRANKSIGNWKKGNGRERKEFIYMYIIWMKIERAHLFIFLWQKHHHFQF